MRASEWLVVVALAWRLTAASAETVQDFDTRGSPFLGCQYGVDPEPQVLPGGPSGRFLRLATTTVPNVNTVVFEVTDPGRHCHIEAEFDFRITPGLGRADGFGFALLNTQSHPTGCVGGGSEEANYPGSFGLGFDIFRNHDLGDINDNHVSIHYDARVVAQVDVSTFVDLASGNWIHATVTLDAQTDPARVTVVLTPAGSDPINVVNEWPIHGFLPYEARVHFGARSGGLSADHDLDNIQVCFSRRCDEAPILAFSSPSFVAVEGGTDTAFITVTRRGDLAPMVSVYYSTADGTARAGEDYRAVSGTVTFAKKQTLQYFSVPIVNDPTAEPDESFMVHLTDPSHGAQLGVHHLAEVALVDPDDDPPSIAGHWCTRQELDIAPVHGHLLPTGRVLLWEDRGQVSELRLWEPFSHEVTQAAIPIAPGGEPYDLFCAGHCFLADGGLLVTGGHDSALGDGHGVAHASVFCDSLQNQWTTLPDMDGRRWYPTNTILSDGSVLVVSGSFDGSFTPNPLPEVWDPALDEWRKLTNARLTLPLYPFMFLAPDGSVFYAGPERQSRFLTPDELGDWRDGPRSSVGYRDYGSAVMFDATVLIVGGTPDPARPLHVSPTATVETIDLASQAPIWTARRSMHFARRQHVAVLMPTGRVLAVGGTAAPGFNDPIGAVLCPEAWDPGSDRWTVLAPNRVRRLYHSIALLLPDGRVVSAGVEHPDLLAEGDIFYKDLEVFLPPYLFQSPRPTIACAPKALAYGMPFLVRSPAARRIAKAVLIRLPSVTHAFDQNQRLSTLSASSVDGAVQVMAPGSPNDAPPGHYMLFIVDETGVPSPGEIVRLSSGQIDETAVCAADTDHDASVGLGDYAEYAGCMTGPRRPDLCAPVPRAECDLAFDRDVDGDIDLMDFQTLLAAYGGDR